MHASDGGDNWKMYLDKLGGFFSKARFLLVIHTPALYQSMPCLEEIHLAYATEGVEVILLGFGDFLGVNNADKWTMITEESPLEHKEMKNKGGGADKSVPSSRPLPRLYLSVIHGCRGVGVYSLTPPPPPPPPPPPRAPGFE